MNNTTYAYDVFDRLTTKTVDGTAKDFYYDDTDQLTSDDGTEYTYDANGNRTMAGYATGTGNRTTNDGTWTYTYDDNGNRVKKSKGASLETWEFGYDVTNRLIAVSKRATDGGTLQLRVDYKYDALGRRIERYEDTNGDGSTDVRERYGYDGEHVWADLDGSNNLTYRRLFGEGIDTPEARVSAGGTVAWYLRDYQNSVIGMVDSGGTSLGTRTYSAFGTVLSNSLGGSGDRYGYTARELDSSTGLAHNRARFYDPALGRWISTDPIGFTAGDANLYRYVGNGPTNGVDPSGLEEKPLQVYPIEGFPRPQPIGPPQFGNGIVPPAGTGNISGFGTGLGIPQTQWVGRPVLPAPSPGYRPTVILGDPILPVSLGEPKPGGSPIDVGSAGEPRATIIAGPSGVYKPLIYFGLSNSPDTHPERPNPLYGPYSVGDGRPNRPGKPDAPEPPLPK